MNTSRVYAPDGECARRAEQEGEGEEGELEEKEINGRQDQFIRVVLRRPSRTRQPALAPPPVTRLDRRFETADRQGRATAGPRRVLPGPRAILHRQSAQ